MEETTADELAEQLSNDGHDARASDIEGLVVIDAVGGRLGSSDIPLGWKIATVHDDGEVHLVN